MTSTWRALFGASWALMLGCSKLLELDELEKADCVGAGCGGAAPASGTAGHGANSAGSHAQAGTSSTPVAGRGGGASSAGSGNDGDGGDTDGGSQSGGSSNGGATSGSGGTSAGAGNGGTSAGGSGGSSVGGSSAGGGGAAGQTGAGGCQPSAVDQSCDGLDQACHTTNADAGCSVTCKGAFVQGASYMSCLAGDTFDQAEAACQANAMHLAKIDSAAENATVLALAQDDYVWVGGSNLADANVFTWMDGAPFYSFSATVGGYENFEPGEPMQDAALRCVQLMQPTNGTWSNWTCAEAQSFVCERY